MPKNKTPVPVPKLNSIKTYTLPKKDKESILKRIAGHLSSQTEIAFAYAHGSFLVNGPFRDLDVAVFLLPEKIANLDPLYECNLEGELTRITEGNFPIDIRKLNSAPIAFQYRAIGGRLLMEKDEAFRTNFVVRTLARYFDIKPILRHHAKEAFSHAYRS